MKQFDIGYKYNDRDYQSIKNIDELDPFLMNIVSDSDLWMFIGSNGSLTAGRCNPDQAIFPYETVDKILEHPLSSGSKTIIKINNKLWKPWVEDNLKNYVSRSLHKNLYGCSVCFEEFNKKNKLNFSWEWTMSDEFGFIRICTLENFNKEDVEIEFIDGISKLIPPGIDQKLYERGSYLAKAYNKHELLYDKKMAIYSLNTPISDRAEPAEQLKAAFFSCANIDADNILISDNQIKNFCQNKELNEEFETRGEWGNFLLHKKIKITANKKIQWIFFGDTILDVVRINKLRNSFSDNNTTTKKLIESIKKEHDGLKRKISMADGIQLTGDTIASIHHFSNTLFNCMRGGTVVNNYHINKNDLKNFLINNNKLIYEKYYMLVDKLNEEITLNELIKFSISTKDKIFIRLIYMYLPLTFSRRHGDPSRPWNRFDINIRDDAGNPVLSYEGNWRDIFQNWEGLAYSFPMFLGNMINIFLNSSTADGYNPYRITNKGIDWEIPDDDDPWSNIGYWGDHQIIYLLRLLEAKEKFYPNSLFKDLENEIYTYANVPYKIKNIDEIFSNPKKTIVYDDKLNKIIEEKFNKVGADAKFLWKNEEDIIQVNLLEKLLVPLLIKMTNFVPSGGIWLNTQRPEWNDANNALAGYGLSIVTTCYIRRYINFLIKIVNKIDDEKSIIINEALYKLINNLILIYSKNDNHEIHHDNKSKYNFVYSLGKASDEYREKIYSNDIAMKSCINKKTLIDLLNLFLSRVDMTLKINERKDGLIHSYNTLKINKNCLEIANLDLMLEGQVSILSCDYLSNSKALRLLNSLKNSELFCPERKSYLLYPNKKVTPFLEKNIINSNKLSDIPLLQTLIKNKNYNIIFPGEKNSFHFNSNISTVEDLNDKIDYIIKQEEYESFKNDRLKLIQLWEDIFDHQSFTGRSSKFFGFEGLGSIYWHMVSKLLLAVQEITIECEGDSKKEFVKYYNHIRNGLGFTKTAKEFGAFPSDAYSHTPSNKGAQQPGMTGQVKEELLTRMGELGIQIEDGIIRVLPDLINKNEFNDSSYNFEYYDVNKKLKVITMPNNSYALTFCQVLFTFNKSDSNYINIINNDNSIDTTDGCALDKNVSNSIFSRDNNIKAVHFYCNSK